jgi:5-methylcytosine-specific restriction endonuclease McrA
VPIKPENKHRYPADWAAIRELVLRRARHHCEFCGVRDRALGGRRSSDGAWLRALPLGERRARLEWPRPGDWAWCDGELCRIVRIVLTIAHLDHTPENCALENLRALCQRCHLRYDAKHHRQQAYLTRRAGCAVGDLFIT